MTTRANRANHSTPLSPTRRLSYHRRPSYHSPHPRRHHRQNYAPNMAPRRVRKQKGQRAISDFFSNSTTPASPIDRNRNRPRKRSLQTFVNRAAADEKTYNPDVGNVTYAHRNNNNNNATFNSRGNGNSPRNDGHHKGKANMFPRSNPVNSRRPMYDRMSSSTTPSHRPMSSRMEGSVSFHNHREYSPTPTRTTLCTHSQPRSRSRSRPSRSLVPCSPNQRPSDELCIQQQLQSLDSSLGSPLKDASDKSLANQENCRPAPSSRPFRFASEQSEPMSGIPVSAAQRRMREERFGTIQQNNSHSSPATPLSEKTNTPSELPTPVLQSKSKKTSMPRRTRAGSRPGNSSNTPKDVVMSTPTEAELLERTGPKGDSSKSTIKTTANRSQEAQTNHASKIDLPFESQKGTVSDSPTDSPKAVPTLDGDGAKGSKPSTSSGLDVAPKKNISQIVQPKLKPNIDKKVDKNDFSSAPKASERDVSDKSTSDSELSDEEDESFGLSTAFLRRSMRATKETQRLGSGPSLSSTSLGRQTSAKNIFSTRDDVGGGSSSEVARLLRQVRRMDAEEAKLQKLRDVVQDGKEDIDNEEMEMKNLADENGEITEQEARAQAKYYTPIRLFKSPVNMQPLDENLLTTVNLSNKSSNGAAPSTKNKIPECMVHRMLVEMVQERNEACRAAYVSQIGPYVQNVYKSYSSSISKKSVEIMFHACIFDTSRDEEALDSLFDALLSTVAQEKGNGATCRGFTPLSKVLEAYGVKFDPCGFECDKMSDVDMSDVILDDAILKSQEERTPEEQQCIEISLRNIRRALLLTAHQISHGWKLSRVMGKAFVQQRDKIDQVITVIRSCIALMLSSFGSRVYKQAGLVVKAVMKRIQEEKWAEARWKMAKTVLSMTNQLHLHVELITYLLPFDCDRCMELSMDIGYLSFYQWCTGPGQEPRQRDVSNLKPSEKAMAFGMQRVSFCMADMVELVERIPEIDKATDVAWASGLCRVLKQMLSMPFVLNRRKIGELKRLIGMTQKVRQSCTRMKFSVAVQETRVALDVTLRCMQDVCQDRQSVMELDVAHTSLKQSKLTEMK